MNFHRYGNNAADDDFMWQDEAYAGPENDDFGDYLCNNQVGFRGGRGGPWGYGMNRPRFFGPPGERGPPGHSGPRFMWGRGFGPAGPPMQPRFRDDGPLTLLMQCGVPKQNLKGLPGALLRLMEAQYCGLCAQEFDNFNAARLHYICKNHIRNQKKWLAQQAEVGSRRNREIPLKSRNLYCELCDVHITSKTHAESHYAGRPHRAIVEGRKIPKNPFLLQEGMNDRVEQLIRREKKSLKPIDESEASADLNEIKLTQPELYCDICKTSVTCTEQMTMHLNGKRHLSKEKQHILKMMKGDNTENETKPAESAETAETAETANAPEDAAAAQGVDASDNKKETFYEDDYDWGNGSGKWDEDPK